MAHSPAGVATLISTVVQVAFRDDTKCADGGEHPAFGAVDLIDTIAVPHWPPITDPRQVEVLREDISRVAIGKMIAVAGPTTAVAASVAQVVAVAVI